MTFAERLAAIRAGMEARGLDLLVAIHDGAHFIEKPNPVMVLSGFKALGPAAVVLDRDGRADLIVTPAWESERAAEACPAMKVVGVEDFPDALTKELARTQWGPRAGFAKIGIAGLSALPWSVAKPLVDAFPQAEDADEVVFEPARTKTEEELAHAREAARIAELGYEHLLQIARPGMSEDELAVEIRWHSRSLGAEDNFVLLCAGPHNRAVAPSNGRRMQSGDIIVVEITPSVRGQLVQICRTIVLGKTSKVLADKYELVTHAMHEGIRAAVPGAPMADVCRAINGVLEAEGYGEYCYPPHIRRRGHGLGFASILPGDVALDNETPLEPGMLFMIHPNQYLPETGYLLCGEPVVVTADGAKSLTQRTAALAEII
jgi:Xaa-Pro aminopeptidase